MKAIFSRIAQGYISRFDINTQSLNLIMRCFYGMTAIVFFCTLFAGGFAKLA